MAQFFSFKAKSDQFFESNVSKENLTFGRRNLQEEARIFLAFDPTSQDASSVKRFSSKNAQKVARTNKNLPSKPFKNNSTFFFK